MSVVLTDIGVCFIVLAVLYDRSSCPGTISMGDDDTSLIQMAKPSLRQSLGSCVRRNRRLLKWSIMGPLLSFSLQVVLHVNKRLLVQQLGPQERGFYSWQKLASVFVAGEYAQKQHGLDLTFTEVEMLLCWDRTCRGFFWHVKSSRVQQIWPFVMCLLVCVRKSRCGYLTLLYG